MRAIFLLIPFILFAANVNISVNKKVLTSGEELIITITAEGKNIKFPHIQEIDGNSIVGVSNSNSISIVNGNMKEIVSQSFILYPQKSLTIPSFTIIINGKTYKTNPIHIKVIEPKQTKGDFELDINISKNNLYLGENAILSLTFIKKAPADSIKIQKPYIKNFLIKEINSTETKKNNSEIITYNFLIIPQKVGKYQIGPFLAQVGKIIKTTTDNFFGLQIANMKYENIYSNKLNIKVNPIPKNSIYGDFNISIHTKKEIEANTPNKITLIISGCGDFYSIEPFSLNIKNTTIYQSKPILNIGVKNNKLCGEFIQNFTVIANKSYTIPSISLKTFDGKIKTISSKEINVTVKNSIPIKNEKVVIHKNTIPTNKKSNFAYIILISLIFLIIGILLGIIFIKVYEYLKNSEIVKIKKADEKELLNILKKYEENPKIKKIMEKIEENIYKNKNNKIDKKDIIKIIKQIRRGR